jgi:hypothetical protein
VKWPFLRSCPLSRLEEIRKTHDNPVITVSGEEIKRRHFQMWRTSVDHIRCSELLLEPLYPTVKYKGKSVPVQALKAYGGGGTAPLILNLDSILAWVFKFFFFTREEIRDIRCIGGWIGPRVGLGSLEKKNLLPVSGIEPRLLGLCCPGSEILA